MAVPDGTELGGSEDGYSHIVKGTLSNGQEVAIKRVIAGTADKGEVENLRKLLEHKQDANIIRYYFLEEVNPFTYIYLELCSGTLRDFVEDPKFDRGGLFEKKAIKQIAKAFEFIHEHGIYHLDVKPSNILITRGPQKRCVLSDFDVSKKVAKGRESIRTMTFLGTRGWIAPEIELFNCDCEKRITRKADIFSFGLLIYYIWTHGSHPFDEQRNPRIAKEKLDKIQKRIKDYGYNASQVLSLEMITEFKEDDVLVRDLLSHLLERTPGSRPDARDVINHPLFWSAAKRCKFYTQVGDCLDGFASMNGRFDSSRRMQKRLDRDKQRVIHGNWWARLHPAVQKECKGSIKNVAQPGQHPSELVKVIRNHCTHYLGSNPSAADVGPPPSPDDLGENVHNCLRSLTGAFPLLLLHTYYAALPWRDDVKFKQFYPKSDFPKFQELQNDRKKETFEDNSCSLKIVSKEKLDVPKPKDGNSPRILDLCIGPNGDLITADRANSRLTGITKTGNNSSIIGSFQSLDRATNVAYSQSKEIIIAEPHHHHVKILDCTTGTTTIITKANGLALKSPHGIAVNSLGQIIVCDTGNKRVVMLDRDGKLLARVEDSGEETTENYWNLAFDKNDSMYVTDTVQQTIHVFSKDGKFIRNIGPTLSEKHSFTECWGITIYEQYMAVTDYWENKVHILTTAGEHMCCIGDIYRPTGIVHDRDGVFYVCEEEKHRIVELVLEVERLQSPIAGTNPARSDVRMKKKPEANTDHSI